MEIKYKFMYVLVVGAIFVSKESLATQHVVGGSQGWDESTDLSSWASGQIFKVGDQLLFKYTRGLHSVVELGSESEYKNCDTSSSSVNSLSGGNNVVKLDKPNTRYFVCGTSGHCDQGMKLKVTTVSSSDTTSSSTPTTSTHSTSDARVSLPLYSFFSIIMWLLVST